MLSSVREFFADDSPSALSRPQAQRRLRLEQLEERECPATFNYLVDSLADAGAGTLRDAIDQANKTGIFDQNIIQFADFGDSQATIGLLSTLTITRNIEISGPGSAQLLI